MPSQVVGAGRGAFDCGTHSTSCVYLCADNLLQLLLYKCANVYTHTHTHTHTHTDTCIYIWVFSQVAGAGCGAVN